MNIGEFEPEILKAYQATTFQVKDSRGQMISFKVADWQQHCSLKRKRFAIITAFNPMNEVKSETENQASNARLEQDLKKTNYEYYPTVGALGGHSEESFTVESIPQDKAVSLGRAFKQYAILYCDETGPYFVRC